MTEAEQVFAPESQTPTPAPGRLGRKPPPPGETRRGSFVRLANERVNKAIYQITLIGNLANRKNYSYKPEDVDKIEAALNDAVRQTIAAFRSPKATVPNFRLPLDGEEEEA